MLGATTSMRLRFKIGRLSVKIIISFSIKLSKEVVVKKEVEREEISTSQETSASSTYKTYKHSNSYERNNAHDDEDYAFKRNSHRCFELDGNVGIKEDDISRRSRKLRGNLEKLAQFRVSHDISNECSQVILNKMCV